MLMSGLNRASRRRLAAAADRTARLLAQTCVDYRDDGELQAVSERQAVAVLERAFGRLLRGGGKPQVLRITNEAAAAFPRQPSADEMTGLAWLAVGVDLEGRATFALRYLNVSGASVADRRQAEARMLEALAEHLARPGFPPWRAP